MPKITDVPVRRISIHMFEPDLQRIDLLGRVSDCDNATIIRHIIASFLSRPQFEVLSDLQRLLDAQPTIHRSPRHRVNQKAAA
jgi:hypothetical protein